MRFDGKVGIITGSGQGIGKGIATQLAKEGGVAIVVDVNVTTAEETAKEIEASGGKAMAAKCDITNQQEVNDLVAKVIEKYGKVDILVNNVGWNKVKPFTEGDKDLWDRVIDINLKGPIICCRAVVDNMMANNYGKIVNVSSDSGRVGSTGEAVYGAAKGGVVTFTKALAREMARYKINVNSVSPGPSDTPFLAEVSKENPKLMEAVKKGIPMRRLAQPEDIANAVLFFCDDATNYITGQILSCSGGLTMHD